MTVKRRDHILVKHRADVIFSFGWLHTACTAETQLYIADTTTEELLVYSFYLNKCPHLQCFGSV